MVLLLLVLSAAALVLLLNVAAILLLTLLLIGNIVDVNTFFSKTDTLFAVATLCFNAFTTTFLVSLLLRTCGLVQAVEVNLALDGKRRCSIRSGSQTEDFFLLLLLWSGLALRS